MLGHYLLLLQGPTFAEWLETVDSVAVRVPPLLMFTFTPPDLCPPGTSRALSAPQPGNIAPLSRRGIPLRTRARHMAGHVLRS